MFFLWFSFEGVPFFRLICDFLLDTLFKPIKKIVERGRERARDILKDFEARLQHLDIPQT